jgi:GTP-binding protein HflX
MISTVNEVLAQIGADDRRVLMVFNKIDAVKDPPLLAHLHRSHEDHVDISARTGKGLAELAARVQQIVEERETSLDWTFSAANGKLLAFLKQRGKLLAVDYPEGESVVRVKALLEPRFMKEALTLRDA